MQIFKNKSALVLGALALIGLGSVAQAAPRHQAEKSRWEHSRDRGKKDHNDRKDWKKKWDRRDNKRGPQHRRPPVHRFVPKHHR